MTRPRSVSRWAPRVFSAIFAICLSACSSDPVPAEAAAERGRELFASGALSESSLNFYRCVTCHDDHPVSAAVRKAGAALAGAVDRPTYWGGQEDDLLRAVNACRTYFMYASAALQPDDPDAVALYAFLSELVPGDSAAAPFSVVRTVEDLPRGNAVSGAVLYDRSCAACHGQMHDAAGALSPRIPLLPEGTLLDHEDLSPRAQRLVFIEKTCHGGFLGYGGAMPPFSKEVLSDSELPDILEVLGVVGGGAVQRPFSE
ncbi:MAG TPA: c-type cytochrome [Polyangiaceae bacterium]